MMGFSIVVSLNDKSKCFLKRKEEIFPLKHRNQKVCRHFYSFRSPDSRKYVFLYFLNQVCVKILLFTNRGILIHAIILQHGIE